MIIKRNTKQFPRFRQPAGDIFISLTGLQAPARMIMRHDDTGRAVGDGVGENLTRVYQAGGQCADGHHPLGNQTISAVQRQADKVFLLFVANVGQQLDRFFWDVDDWLVAIQQVPPR